MTKLNLDKATAIRILVLIAALANQALVVFGISPIPFTTAEIEAGLAVVFSVVATLWATWKNNDVTEEAKRGSAHMGALKAKNKRKGGVK